jgi:hypothetical protein
VSQQAAETVAGQIRRMLAATRKTEVTYAADDTGVYLGVQVGDDNQGRVPVSIHVKETE